MVAPQRVTLYQNKSTDGATNLEKKSEEAEKMSENIEKHLQNYNNAEKLEDMSREHAKKPKAEYLHSEVTAMPTTANYLLSTEDPENDNRKVEKL
ncbi:hypothetical protein ACJMK2_038917 [Sinanodonta woodiana]|uniref:Uncharacterized protein n=1 Tax=Sinanodonta woodiana TaxID=1069815 RepID=A0ABD3WBA2_SINWO